MVINSANNLMHRTPNSGIFSFGRLCGAGDKSVMGLPSPEDQRIGRPI
jgi:hypothetical protein